MPNYRLEHHNLLWIVGWVCRFGSYGVVDGLFDCELAVENNPTNLVSFTIGIGCVFACCLVCVLFL